MEGFFTNAAWFILIMLSLSSIVLICGIFNKNVNLDNNEIGSLIVVIFFMLIFIGVSACWIWR